MRCARRMIKRATRCPLRARAETGARAARRSIAHGDLREIVRRPPSWAGRNGWRRSHAHRPAASWPGRWGRPRASRARAAGDPARAVSMRFSGTTPQFTATNEPLERGEAPCRRRATTSLPVPVSPATRTVTGVGATCSMRPSSSTMASSCRGGLPRGKGRTDALCLRPRLDS